MFRFKEKREKRNRTKQFSGIGSSENTRKHGLNSNLLFKKTVKTSVFAQVQILQWPSHRAVWDI